MIHPSFRSTYERAKRTFAGTSRQGFALFMALGALVIIAVLVAGSSFITMQETRLGQNQLVETKAFSAAEYGLNKIQADWDKTPNLTMAAGNSFDTNYVMSGQGTVKVRYTRLNNETFWIVSEGRATVGNSINASRVSVKRVGAILRLRIPTIQANAAITAGGNVAVQGGADIYGQNTPPPEWGTACNGTTDTRTDTAGIIVPSGSTVTTQGNGSTINGSPPYRTDPLAADSNTFVRFGDETWNGLVSMANLTFAGGTIGNAIAPSASAGSCNKADVNNWGEPHRSGTDYVPSCINYFPIIYSSGSVTLNGNGRGQGILLIKGSVTINGHFEWDGLIIVTDDIVRGNGAATIYGGVMARNEVKADGSSTISGNTTYNFSACALQRAMRGAAQITMGRERAWTEIY